MKPIFKHIIVTIAFIVLVFTVGAQSLQPTVIGTLGGYSAPSGSASLSYNMGETFVITLTGGAFMLTQGFEQPFGNLSSITGVTSVCVGNTTTLSDSTAGGAWSSSNTAIATVGSTGSLSGVVTGIAAGIDTISYTVSGSVATKVITINPLPSAGTITGTSSVCIGTTITLTDTTTGGVWSSSSGSATVGSTGSLSGVVTGVSAGMDTIKYSVTNSCGTAIATKIITVNPLPAAGIITGAASVCVGATITLMDTTTGGVWSSSSSSAIVGSTGSLSGIVTGVLAGADTIKYSVTNSCGTAVATKTITVNPLPAAGIITGVANVCLGATITLTDTTIGGIWSSSSSSATVGSTGSLSGVVTGVSAGVDTIKYSVTNSCGTAISSKIITVNPLPVAGIITGASSVCVGATITLTDTTAGGVWSSSSSSATIGSTGSLSGVVTGVSAGVDTIRYSITNLCGTAIATKTITVNPLPAAGTITGAASVCAGATITLTDTTPGGVWSSSSSSATIGSTGSLSGVVTGVLLGVDTISYSVTNSCGTAIATKIITVNPLPVAGIITGASSVCAGASITLTDTTTGGVWSSSSGSATVGSTGSLSGVVTGVSVGVDTIQYSVTNSCGTAIATKIITINPLPTAGIITGASNVCVGATITLTDTTTGGVWSSSGSSATVGSTGSLSGVVTGVSAGVDTIKYSVTNSCGTAIAIKIITVNPLPVAGIITGATSLCIGATITLTDTTTGGVWSSSNSSATVGSTGSLSGVVTGVSVGVDTIQYSVTNSCGTAIATKIITINPLPVAGIITGAFSVCLSATITLTDTTLGGVWSSSNSSATVGSTGSLSGVVTGVSAGVDTIKYSVTNSCGTAIATKIITVNPLPVAGGITGASDVCIGTTITLTDTTIGGVWSSSGSSATVGSTGTLSGVVTGVSVGMDTIKYSITNSCGTAIATKTITVNPLPAAGTITGAASVCAGATITLMDTTTGGVWSSSGSSATVGSTGTLSGVVTGVSAGVDTIRYSVTNSCGTAMAIMAITIDSLPNAGSITGPDSLCVNITSTLTEIAVGGTWSSSDTLIATVSGAGGVLGVSVGVDTIVYTVTNVCGIVHTIFPIYISAGNCIPHHPITLTSLKAYPNPNDGSFAVLLSSPTNEQAVVTITNIFGQKLNEFTITANVAVDIDLRQPAGMYFVTAMTKEGRFVTKVSVK